MIKWFKTKLYGEESLRSRVYYQPKVPNPKKGWLRKSALLEGNLWIDTKNANRVHVWTGTLWRRLSVD